MSDKNSKKQQSFAADIFDWMEMIVLSACIVLLIFTFVARPAKVDGISMQETLHDGEMLLISNLFFTPECGDIVVLQKINSIHPAPIVKRVIATEGETIDIDFDSWRVTITDKDGNMRILDESDYRKLTTDVRVTSDFTFPITVGEGQLFVMGDNRNHSLDSRSSAIGLVDEEEIIGKVLCRFFPLDKIGIIN